VTFLADVPGNTLLEDNAVTLSNISLIALLLSIFAGPAIAGIQFSEPVRIPAGDSPSSVVSAELTGDEHLDLLVVNRVSDDNFPQGVIATDFDGDMKADIVTTAVPFNSGTVAAWLGNGNGTFQSPEVLVADDGTRAVEIADIDNDGRLDIVVTNKTRDNISTFLGDGDGTFGAEIRTVVGTTGAAPSDLAIADFNGDGNLDVVTSNGQSLDNSIGLVLGDGDGTFGVPTPFPTTCSRPESIVTRDFNRDGQMDVAVACFFSSDVVVMLGDGSGGFASPLVYSLLPDQANPYWILSADFDNDRFEDLVTSNNGGFSVLRGNGDGTFEQPIGVESSPGTFFGAYAADFDEDGWLDLAFANFGLDEVTVFLNTTALCAGSPCPPYLQGGAGSTFSWSSLPEAIGYDMLRGDVQTLLTSGGDFTTATTDCVAGSTPLLSYTDTGNPGSGDAFWFLVREVTAKSIGSYDAHSGNLAESRDAEISASGLDCP